MRKNVKRLFTFVLVVGMLAFGMAGCGAGDGAGGEAGDGAGNGGAGDTGGVSEIVNVAVLNGPTGMGAVQLTDMPDKYNVETYEAPTDIAPKLISGEVDVAALPSNMAAVLYNKTGGEVVAVTPVTLGVLYILGNDVSGQPVRSLADLKGRTIVSSGQGGTPEYALQKVLAKADLTMGEDVQVQWLASHADVNQKLLSEPGTIAMVPEPFVSAALAQSVAGSGEEQGNVTDKAQAEGVKILFDMNQLWQDATGQEFPMGVLVARVGFAKERAGDLETLLGDLKASVDFVNEDSDEAAQMIVDKGFLGDAAVAKAAIPGCKLVCFGGAEDKAGDANDKAGGAEDKAGDANDKAGGAEDLAGDAKDKAGDANEDQAGGSLKDGAEMLKVFNETMFEINPESVGGSLPGDDLYYGAK